MGYDEIVKIHATLKDSVSRKLNRIDRKFKSLQKYGIITSDFVVEMVNEEKVHREMEKLERDGFKKIYVQMLRGDKPISYRELMEQSARKPKFLEQIDGLGKSRKIRSGAFDFSPPPGFARSFLQDITNDYRNAREEWTRAGYAKRRLGKAIDFVIPRYSQLLRIFSALVPLLIILIAGALGVAAAFGAIALAGASVIGLGLIGEGRSIDEAWRNAKETLNEFKNELFEVFQPTAALFNPISERFFGNAPRELRTLAVAMRDMTVFEDGINSSFRGLIEWVSEAIVAMSAFEPILTQLTLAFGKAIGESIIKFLQFVTMEAYQNQDALMQMGETFAVIMSTIYNFSLTFSKLLVALLPVFNILELMTQLLANEFGVGIAVAIGGIFLMAKAVVFLQTQFTMLYMAIVRAKAAMLGFAVGGVALSILAGVGAGMVVNDLSQPRPVPSGGLGTSGGDTYNIVVEGDMTDKNRREIESMITEQSIARDSRSLNMSR